eukprot:CAMPEP_0194070566 /NCGR_PEP_ID=MMETSP0009_2-20130614/88249_1 /TAXON_ID=210454 /ORGANISM="Grammatophora oceanica, Strain CCMP 410" /LENGTH=77 /DNA_ID=CAMNT_0038723845 /DNA_START=96 /DNA_END=329 /DNA_ORIENTATION=-
MSSKTLSIQELESWMIKKVQKKKEANGELVTGNERICRTTLARNMTIISTFDKAQLKKKANAKTAGGWNDTVIKRKE